MTHPTLDELRALKMASKGRCPLVRAINLGEEAAITYEPVDGWLPMPNAIRVAVEKGWMTLDPPQHTDGVGQHGILTETGTAVLDQATCTVCGLLLADGGRPDEVCLPPSSCWKATWSDSVLTGYVHVSGKAHATPSQGRRA